MLMRHGPDCLAQLNGMFALALYDSREKTLLLARDPAGIKPLYYRRQGREFLFASEVKALLAYHEEKGRPHLPGIADYFVFQYTLGTKTMFSGVEKLSPGEWMRVSDDLSVSRGRHFTLDFEKNHTGFQEAAQEFESLFASSVRLQIRSDVPLGVHLSGGLDTGIIAYETSRLLTGGVDAFSAKFAEGGVYDDTKFAGLTAAHVKARLHVVEPSREDFVLLLPELIRCMDEPAAGEGLFPQYCVSRRAASTVKVILGGQGADELLGGYARYYLFLWMSAMRREVLGQPPIPGFGVSDMSPFLPQLRNYWPLMAQVTEGPVFPDDDELFFRMIRRCASLDTVMSQEAIDALGGYSPRNEFSRLFNAPGPDVEPLDKALYFETTQWLPALLQVEDRMSMACSLESRVPFLDPHIIRFAFRTPGPLKMRHGRTKSLVREAAKRRLPNAISNRHDKIGFPVPLGKWGLRDALPELLGDLPAEFSGLLRPEYVSSCLDGGGLGDRRFWGWLCLALWWKIFIR